ncbi:hypothetical protein NPX13_g8536 [Xylaria arbuscula]|uniref:Uncharacterized protein n=1 Tax=Xylaria arbuscula TaxID=114810 RepID=A0A9W8N8J2_9PEZI|nr:hypothetical protein NPX13_g8536 [Xylaria arbuscula]
MSVLLTATTSAVTAVATAVASEKNGTHGGGGGGGGGGEGECRLLGPFALFVQLGLGALALLSLVYKRWRERPQRPLKIWFFDASKQVFGSVLVHMANIFMSMLTSGRFSIQLEPSGVENGRETITKSRCDWALKWTEGNEKLQIFFVMMLFPLIMNAIQYYIIDSFIKLKETGHERLPQEDSDERDPFNDTFGDESDEESISNESNNSVQLSRSATFKGATQKGGSKNDREEYDPNLDGQTVVGSSRSQEERDKLLTQELAPHE